MTIPVDWISLLDGGFAAATILISFGAVIGKTTPTQLLALSLIEVPLYFLNSYIGYTILGAIDVGEVLRHARGKGLLIAVDRMHYYLHLKIAKF